MSWSTAEKYARALPTIPRMASTVATARSGILLVCLVVGYLGTPHMAFATCSYGLLILGLLLRQHPKAHATLMSLGIVGDLGLVLLLEVQRGAINTAVSFTLSPLQQAHIGMSTLATVLYFPTLYLGIQRLRGLGDRTTRSRHLTFGLLALVFRTLGFIFMFSLLGRPTT